MYFEKIMRSLVRHKNDQETERKECNMTLTLSAHETGYGTRTRTLSAQELTHASLEIWKVKGRPQSCDIGPDMFKTYLPKCEANHRPRVINLRLIGDRWLVVDWFDNAVGIPLSEGTEFIYRSSPQYHFHYFPIPSNCEVDPRTGKITIEHNGELLTFSREAPSWPDQMLDPGKYVAIGMLETLLTPNDENPLTMLIGADRQPYSGTAKQLLRKLKKIQNLLRLCDINPKQPDPSIPPNAPQIMRAIGVGTFPIKTNK